MNTPHTLNDICDPKDFVKNNPTLIDIGSMTHILKMRHKNGLQETGAIIKPSRKLQIIIPLFTEWYLSRKA